MKDENFDAVHVLESQHSGYLYAKVVEKLNRRPPTALSIWGSDLSWFGKSERHKDRIIRLLAQVDLMLTECSRDQHLARHFGFRGAFSVRFPASGGVGLSHEFTPPSAGNSPSTRLGVVIKGYTGFVGQAAVALQAVIQKRDLLRRFDIVVYSASWWMLVYVRYLRFRYQLRIVAYRKKSLTHGVMLSLFQNARVSLAVSLCDGFPGSAREAIWAGAFPIESIGSCVGEWLTEGVTCLLVDPHEPATIAKALERALTDDALVDLATQSNSDVIKKLTIEEVKVAAVREYQRLLQLTHVNRKG